MIHRMNVFRVTDVNDNAPVFVSSPYYLNIRNISNKNYNVLQSDGNSFCGDVVLDSFNMVCSDEDSIYDLKYEKKDVFGIFMTNNLHFKGY